MNLRQLEVFYAVMKTGTVSGAAKQLFVSQPNVTRVLSHTEQQLGFALFERVKGRLVATREAKLLLPEAEKVYQQLGQFRNLTNKIKAGEKHITIGAPPILATMLIAPIVEKISQSTDYTVDIATGNRDELCDALIKNELDLAICFGEESPAGIVQQPLLSDTMRVLTPATDTPKARYQLSELIDSPQPLIGLDPRDPLGLQLHQAIHAIDANYHPKISVRSYSAAAEMVAQGNCYAVVDPWTERHYQQRVLSAELDPSIPITVSLLHSEYYPLSIAAKWFVEQLKTSL